MLTVGVVCVYEAGGLCTEAALGWLLFTPAVVMSVESVSIIPAQKLRPGLCVNLCIQVHYVKSSQVKPKSGSAGKLVFLGQNLFSSIIPIYPSFRLLSEALQHFPALFGLFFLQLQVPLLTFCHSPTLLLSVSSGGLFPTLMVSPSSTGKLRCDISCTFCYHKL